MDDPRSGSSPDAAGSSDVVELQVLGPVEAFGASGRLPLGGPKQQLVLAVLTAHAGLVVSDDGLIDAVWGDEPPPTAKKALQGYVANLRAALGGLIERRGAGYRLELSRARVDSRRVELLIDRARTIEDPEGAAGLFRTALASWHGRPYEGLADAEALRSEVARLEELRLAALEDRIEADLACGRHGNVVAELESLTTEFPLRERLRMHHMVALYRSGRQAEALRGFERTRVTLVEQLGIDPSPELQRLEQRILEQDPSLEAAPGASQPASRTGLDQESTRGYELMHRIGEGDFGVVYRAYQTSVGREVAVKVIRPEYANRPDFVRHFETRARYVAQLEHPHIAAVYDFWRDPGAAYVVTPLLRGGSLAEGLKRGPWNIAPALHLLAHVGAALSFAHRNRAVHGDLKPGNVLLDEDGNAYVSDFVISSRIVDETGTPVTSSPGYVPPEEYRGEPLTARSDIFSLGVLTFELLTGVSPFEHPLPPLSTTRLGLPEDLDRVIRIATEEDPANRPERVEDFLRGLRTAVGADVVGAAPVLPSASQAQVRNPYKGLRAFQETDASDFFGRDALVDELIDALRTRSLVALVGPSGSGKSSVLRAGLLPAVRSGAISGSREWIITDMYPGSHPFEELEAALLRVAVEPAERLIDELQSDERGLLRIVKRMVPPGDGDLVLVIDQFEELFSMVESETIRRLFIGALTALAVDERGRVRIVLTIRADFFDRPLNYPEFADLVRAGLVTVAPPSEESLALAITRPARGVGLDLEPGLVGEIVHDVHRQPGGLPLMQHVLTELFHRREGDELTIDAYRTSGGVIGALGRRAEEIYGGLPPAGREAARQLFLRLVTVDEGTDVTRRRVRQTELNGLDVGQSILESVVHQFAAYRLLTFDRDPITRSPTVEVAHEALLDEWKRLTGWIEQQREALILHRRLAAALSEWDNADHDPAFLLGGGRLESLETWAEGTTITLTADESRYLAESRKVDDGRRRRRSVRRVWLIGVLAVALTAISVLAVTARDRARVASVYELAAASTAAVTEDPELGILLGLQAVERAHGPGGGALSAAMDALHLAMGSSRITERIPAGDFVAVSPDARTLVTGSSKDSSSASIWPITGERALTELSAVSGKVAGAAYSPDGSMVAVGYVGDETLVRVFDAASGDELASFPGSSPYFPVQPSFSPDGRLLAAAGCTDNVPVWDVATGSELYRVEGKGSYICSASFSPDGGMLALADQDEGLITLHDATTGIEVDALQTGGMLPDGVAFHPSGDLIAVKAQGTGRIAIWEVEGGDLVSSAWVTQPTALAWSPDGTTLAVGGNDGIVRIIDPMTGSETMALRGHPTPVWSLSYTPASDRLVTAGYSGDTLVWDITPSGSRDLRTLQTPYPRLAWFRFTPDGSRVIAVSLEEDRGMAGLLDAESGSQVAAIDHQNTAMPSVPWISEDGRWIGTVGLDGRATIVDAVTMQESAEVPNGWHAKAFSADGRLVLVDDQVPDLDSAGAVLEIGTWRQVLKLDDALILSADFSPDGRFVAAVSQAAGGRARVYDLHSGAEIVAFAPESVVAANFSPDGTLLAVGTDQGAIRILDVSSLVAGATSEDALINDIAAHNGLVVALDWSPDSKLLASGGYDSRIRVWDVARGERVADLVTGLTDTIPWVDFHPDGRHLLAQGNNGTLRLYTLDPDELVRTAGSRVTRSLTSAECERFLHMPTCPDQ